MESPWLTIVTVVKDDPDGFSRTAASMGHQSVPAFEWIVVDGSRDRAEIPTILRSVGLPVRYVWCEPAGVYSAMNAGLSRATGTYVYFLNGGDRLHSDSSIATIRQGLASDPVWMYGQVAFVSTDGTSHTPAPFHYVEERSRLFARGRFPAHQGTVVRTTVLRDFGGFDDSYRITADYVTTLRLSQLDDPLELDEVIADFYLGGVSSTSWPTSLREFHRARREILHPTGRAAIRERLDTANQGLRLMTNHWAIAPARRALGVGR